MVCGDYCLCERTPAGFLYVVCDGIGSGAYANISAITCAGRITELFSGGLSLRAAAETVAASMHRARTEDIPFAAFSAAIILPDGQFTAYSYEAPSPVLIQDKHATALTPRFYTAGFEIIAEVSGCLNMGDCLLIFSDGVSQAGLGHGYGMGIGSDGVCDYINRNYKPHGPISELPEKIAEMCKSVSAGNYEDDTTIAALYCRCANELALLTGPPSKQSLDNTYVTDFMNMPGSKVVCGSTTAEITARELKSKVTTLFAGNSFGQPPEYRIEGIDLVTEGAITLNQVFNIMDEPAVRLTRGTAAERLCLMLRGADAIHLMIGNAANTAHEDLIFKQIGVNVRKSTIRRISERLRDIGKLVTIRYY